MTENASSSRLTCRDPDGVVHLVMFDSEGERICGICWCGLNFAWNSMTVIGFDVDVIVVHADAAPVTCLGCIAYDLG